MPIGYAIIPIVMLLVFGGPALLPWIYHPSAFRATAWFYLSVAVIKLKDPDFSIRQHWIPLVVFAGVVFAAWMSQKRIPYAAGGS
jgi:hypothetical protein